MKGRSTRDWIVDTVAFLLAVAFGILVANQRLRDLPDPAWFFDVDQIFAALGCVALWLRRRWPVQLAVAMLVLGTFSELISGAVMVAVFTVAVHRPPRTTLFVSVLGLASSVIYVCLRPEPAMSRLSALVFGLVIQGAVVGWGLFVHHRRQLVLSLRDRAARAETEAQLRVHEAREEVARDMHDVLGHRLSLLSVHAGALEYNPDASPDDIARAAKVIRESAHQALQDLREVIGVLRAPVDEVPQPKLVDIEQLVTESRKAGMRVDLHQELPGDVPDRIGLTAYRIVQEALTNARKHAPGAEVRIVLRGAPEEGLTVEVCNAVPTQSSPRTSSGSALIGLAERVALAGGRLSHGPSAGGWRIGAWLPWPA
jgi:signal transduction histidine kinase